MRSLAYKTLVSIYCLFNLLTISYMNLMDGGKAFIEFLFNNFGTRQQFYRYQLGEYYLRVYAHFVGLDNRWHMFGHQSRFNWHYRIIGVYSDGKRTLEAPLPDPRQLERSQLQYHLVDFKEGKFHLNIYNFEVGRFSYAYYLARQRPSLDGLPIRRVLYRLATQRIREPQEAREKGFHFDPDVHEQLYSDLPIFLDDRGQPVALAPGQVPVIVVPPGQR